MSGRAEDSGLAAKVARKLFENRGNHSEMHLSEDELTIIIETAFELRQKIVSKDQ